MTDASGPPRVLQQLVDEATASRLNAVEAGAAQLQGRLSRALEASNIGVWDLDLTRQSITLSKECFPILGIESTTLESTVMESMIHPDDRPEVDAAFLVMLGGGAAFDREFRLVRPDGEVRWVSDRARAVPDDRGEMTRVVGVVQDVTGRKRAEAVLRAQNRVLERIAAGDGLHEVLAEIIEVVEAQVSGARCSILVLDGDRLRFGAGPRLPEAYNRAVDGVQIGPMVGCCGAAVFLGEVVVTEDIETDPRWADFRDVALPHGLRSCWSTPIVAGAGPSQSLASGRVLGTFALYHDRPSTPTPHEVESVSGAVHLASIAIERDQAEHTIRESAERMGQIESTRDQVFWICTLPDLNVAYMSPSVVGFLGVATAEKVRTRIDWSELIHPDDRARVAEVLQRWLADPALDVFDVEFRVLKPDGSVRWVTDRGRTIRDARGHAYRAIGVVTDITERKMLEERLTQAQKMEAVGRLAGGVAHDFNNLLTVINGFSEAMLLDTGPDDPRRDALVSVIDAGRRAADLTQQLLAFSRKAIVKPELVDLNERVESIGRMLRRLIGEDVILVTRLTPSLSRVMIDPSQLEQVLMNLAVNARDAMPRGGTLTIETRDVTLGADDDETRGDLAPGPYARLSVSDTGLGMSGDVRERVFEPFFTTKDFGKGTGLGLATVFGVVKQAGGHIRVESEVGRGSAFVVLLPAHRNPPRTSRRAVEVGAPRGSETVLLVEDEDGVRRLARVVLERQGYAVLDASSASEALKILDARGGAIDLLVTDVVMPQMDGRELADAVRARSPSTRVLFMSGYMDDAVMRHGVGALSEAFLQKPFTPAMLARKVREVLDKPQTTA